MSISESRKRIADKIYEHFHGESVKDFAQREKDSILKENASILKENASILKEKDSIQKENEKNRELLRKSVAQFLNLGMSPKMIAEALGVSLSQIREIQNEPK